MVTGLGVGVGVGVATGVGVAIGMGVVAGVGVGVDVDVRAGATSPVAEKPWVSFMGRPLLVPNMPESAQRHLGIYDNRQPGII